MQASARLQQSGNDENIYETTNRNATLRGSVALERRARAISTGLYQENPFVKTTCRFERGRHHSRIESMEN
jgi:hypothetical protein